MCCFHTCGEVLGLASFLQPVCRNGGRVLSLPLLVDCSCGMPGPGWGRAQVACWVGARAGWWLAAHRMPTGSLATIVSICLLVSPMPVVEPFLGISRALPSRSCYRKILGALLCAEMSRNFVFLEAWIWILSLCLDSPSGLSFLWRWKVESSRLPWLGQLLCTEAHWQGPSALRKAPPGAQGLEDRTHQVVSSPSSSAPGCSQVCHQGPLWAWQLASHLLALLPVGQVQVVGWDGASVGG